MVFEWLGLGSGRTLRYRVLVLVLTFFTYASFHMSRKAPSIVKGALHPHVESAKTSQDWNPVTNPGWEPFADDLDPTRVSASGYAVELSYICEVNSDGGAGVYRCAAGGMRVATDYYNISYCARYVADNGKFHLRLLSAGDDPKAVGGCSRHGANSSAGCWVINGVYKKLSTKERNALCVQHEKLKSPDCTLYVQPGGHLIPAPGDDKIGWIDVRDDDYTNQTRVGINVFPASITNGKILLGGCDTVYLIFYAIGLFVSGHIADHMSLRIFLTIGMLGSGTFVALIGLAHAFAIHNLWYFYVCYAIQGLFQSTGWPAVVAVMGNWFPKNSRGFVMGVWNAHTSVGNIVGSLVSGAALGISMDGADWPAAFYLSGGMIGVMGMLVFLFLPNKPEDVGLPSIQEEEEIAEAQQMSDSLVANQERGIAYNTGKHYQSVEPADDDEDIENSSSSSGNTFFRALRIPGVVEFAFALFFAKFVAYMFIYWLPYYLGHLKFSTEEAADISAYFDLGGIVGGIIAGWVSDRIQRRAPVAFVYLLLAIPALFFYRSISASVGDSSLGINILIMLVCGAFVNGPYALITTAVSADLGSHPSLKGDLSLTATVTGIIDGTGSVGASIQGVLIGVIASGCTATGQSWDAVFDLLMIMCALSALCLTRLVWKQGPSLNGGVGCCSCVMLYRAVVVVCLLGVTAVAVYNSSLLLQSCAGSEVCKSLALKDYKSPSLL
jgi:OPA family glycerol-3-phosphate transporter-like MFS transporter 1/2